MQCMPREKPRASTAAAARAKHLDAAGVDVGGGGAQLALHDAERKVRQQQQRVLPRHLLLERHLHLRTGNASFWVQAAIV